MSTARDLADRYHRQWLRTHAFAAASYGIPGYDDLVPDDSEAGDDAWRSAVESMRAEARALHGTELSAADGITTACVIASADQELAMLDSAALEHTVTAMPYGCGRVRAFQ